VAVEALIERASRRYGVDLRLAKAIAWTESRFDQVRNSPKGARGAMQLMPTTARRFGVTNICDPASNIDGGVRYLRSLIDEFGNPLLAAAAYNAGEQSIYDHHGVPPYRETVTYLVNVLNHQLGLQPPVNVATKRRPATDDDRLPAENGGVIGTTHSAKFVGGVMQF
jgi:soluble lytic murein transglycosylase-like protein